MTTRRILLSLVGIAVLGFSPILASTEDTAPVAPKAPQVAKAKRCATGATNADGTPVMGPCAAAAEGKPGEAPPVNTIEDVYPAGSLSSVLAEQSEAAPASTPAAKPSTAQRSKSRRASATPR